MSDAAAADTGKWRPPSNLREAAATILALALTLVAVQVIAPLAKQATFLTEEIRNYVAGLGFAIFPPAYSTLNRGMQSVGAKPGLLRPDLPPWFVTGITAAALLFVWNTFVGFVAGFGMGVALGQMMQAHQITLDPASVTGFLTVGGTFIALPLTAIAAVFAGMLLNRWTRSGVIPALILASVTYLGLNVFLTYVMQPDMIRVLVSQSTSTLQAAAIGAGVALVAFITFIFGLVGVIISRVRRERSIGRLVIAARRLTPKDRDHVTEDVLAMIQRRR